MRRAASVLEQKFFNEEQQRLIKMIRTHPDAGKGKPIPQPIKAAVKQAQERLYQMGYRPTSQGLEIEDDTELEDANEVAWSKSRIIMHDALNTIREKAAKSS